MEARKHQTLVPSIRVKDMQQSLDFYTKKLGFQATDKLTRKDGKVVHASIGVDSPMFMLSPIEYVRTTQTKEDLAKNKLGIGVEFHVGVTGSRKLDELFAELKGKGVAFVSEPKTESWGDRLFTVRDPDGYALTFSEHVNDVTQEARLAAFESTHQK